MVHGFPYCDFLWEDRQLPSDLPSKVFVEGCLPNWVKCLASSARRPHPEEGGSKRGPPREFGLGGGGPPGSPIVGNPVMVSEMFFPEQNKGKGVSLKANTIWGKVFEGAETFVQVIHPCLFFITFWSIFHLFGSHEIWHILKCSEQRLYLHKVKLCRRRLLNHSFSSFVLLFWQYWSFSNIFSN